MSASQLVKCEIKSNQKRGRHYVLALFYGAVLKINDINFFVPVSSKLHYKQDDMLIKGKDKKSPYLGTLRFRYMIPVPTNCLSLLVRDDLSSAIQGERVRKELAFCRKNKDKISDQVKATYK